MKKIALVGLAIASAGSFDAIASYSMFCELSGEIVSTPVESEFLKFDVLVKTARDIEFETLGYGNPDCHLLQGRVITVALEKKVPGDSAKIVEGARIVLERYEMDVVNTKTGAVYRNVKHVRKGVR